MSIIFNKYENKIDHSWYDSSNVIYSACYDSDTANKTLKVVFKNGGTYLYKDVSVDDYIQFKMAESNGSTFNKLIKKYKTVRLSDTDMAKLEEKKSQLINESNEVSEITSKLSYTLQLDNNNGNFRLLLNGKPIFEGVEEHVSIVRLLRSMGIAYNAEVTEINQTTEEDFEKASII